MAQLISEPSPLEAQCVLRFTQFNYRKSNFNSNVSIVYKFTNDFFYFAVVFPLPGLSMTYQGKKN